MSRIQTAFDHGKAFIPFLTCADPDLETTEKLVLAMAQAGADLIELGIPFSDPVAEGPVIQQANVRALSGGVTTDRIFELVHRLRQRVEQPMVFMTYANVVFSYGVERFAQTAAQAGMDGLILPDVPLEEKEEFAPAFRQQGMDFISLAAPTSRQRVERIAQNAEGFVYCVSSLGVTGVRSRLGQAAGELVEQVRRYTDCPAAVGFGISTPEQAAEVARYADGVIVGSAIVELVARYGREAAPYAADYVKTMKQAIANIQ